MADGVEDADSRNSPSNNRKDLPREIIQSRLMLLVNNVDGFDLCHEHDLLSGFIVESPAGSDGIPVFLDRFFSPLSLHGYRDDLEVVEEV